MLDRLLIGGTQPTGDAQPAVPPHRHDLTHRDGKAPVYFFALRHIADNAVFTSKVWFFARDLHGSGMRGDNAHDGFEEGRFSRTVHADQSAYTPGTKLESSLVQGAHGSIMDAQIFDFQQCFHRFCIRQNFVRVLLLSPARHP